MGALRQGLLGPAVRRILKLEPPLEERAERSERGWRPRNYEGSPRTSRISRISIGFKDFLGFPINSLGFPRIVLGFLPGFDFDLILIDFDSILVGFGLIWLDFAFLGPPRTS